MRLTSVLFVACCAVAALANPAAPLALTDATFEHDTQAATGATTGTWFVLFSAPWCGYCKQLAPVWESLAEAAHDHGGVIAQVDCTANGRTCRRFGVRGYPTLILFRHGRMHRYTGPRTLEALGEFVKTPSSPGESVPAEAGFFGDVQYYAAQVGQDAQVLYKMAPNACLAAVALFGVLFLVVIFMALKAPSPQRRAVRPSGSKPKTQ